MTSNQEMLFDPNCGISEEEQREIFAQINRITEKNRRSLASGGDAGKKQDKKQRFKAQKSGGLFPTLVNAAAIAALAAGFFALYTFQGKTNIQVREGAKVYNTAERALIDEIRKETSSRLEAKENEISLIASQLAGIDAELQGLQSNSAERNRLRATQEEYRSSLVNLQDERSRILEESRSREANLQAQLESRTRELALGAAAIDSALGEMDRLSREQAQAGSVEAQMGAFFANLNRAINDNRLDEAAEIIKSMRNFLNTPAFQSLRSIQERKDLYTQAINSFETMILALSSGELSLDTDSQQLLERLQEQNTRLERDAAEKDRTLAALNSNDNAAAKRLSELEGSVSALRNMSQSLEASVADKNTQIRTLETEGTALRQTVNRQNTVIANRDQCLDQIRGIVQGRSIADMTFNELNDSLSRILEALRSLD